jgi:hypothetical protein
MELGMYVIAPEPISTVYFINLSHQSLCLYVYSLTVVRQRFGKNFIAATNTETTNKGIVGRVVFHAARIVSKKSRLLVLPRTCDLTFLRFLVTCIFITNFIVYNLPLVSIWLCSRNTNSRFHNSVFINRWSKSINGPCLYLINPKIIISVS